MNARVLGIGTLVGVVAACELGNPPMRYGQSTLQFGRASAPSFGPPTQIFLQYDLDNPFDAWSFRGSTLVNDANTPVQGLATTAQPFDLTATPLQANATPGIGAFAQYQSSHAFWRSNVDRGFQEANQHEVVLYARETDETFNRLVTLSTTQFIQCIQPPCTIDEQLRDKLLPGELPDAAAIAYPPRAGWNTDPQAGGPVAVSAFYSPSSFWSNGVTPMPPGSLPAGTGSIKNAMVINHGLCSQLARYADSASGAGLLSPIVQKLATEIEQRLAEGSPTMDGAPSATVFINQSDTLSLVRTSDERDPSPQGAFMLAFNGSVHIPSPLGFPFGDADVQFEVAVPFAWKLLDGRLTVDPLRDVAGGSSTFLAGISGEVGQLLGSTLEATFDESLLPVLSQPVFPFSALKTFAGTVFQTADETQVFSGIPPTPCTPLKPGDDRIPAVANPVNLPSTLCGGKSGFFGKLKNDLQLSLTPGHFGDFVGVPQTAFTQMWDDTILAQQSGFFENVRCAPSTAGPNTCQLVLPARRINPFPDGEELVFVDDDTEYDNPAFAVWLVLGDAADKTLLGKLCDAPRQETVDASHLNAVPLDARSYVDAKFDDKTFSAVNCVQVTSSPTNTYQCTIQVQ